MRVFFVGLDGNDKEMRYNEGDRRRDAVMMLNSLFRKTNEGEFGRIAREAFQTDDPKLEELVKEGLGRYETMAEATLREGEEKGRKEGKAEGIVDGEEKGMNKLLMLIQRLLSDGRSNDIERVSSDTVYCKELLMEYGIA